MNGLSDQVSYRKQDDGDESLQETVSLTTTTLGSVTAHGGTARRQSQGLSIRINWKFCLGLLCLGLLVWIGVSLNLKSKDKDSNEDVIQAVKDHLKELEDKIVSKSDNVNATTSLPIVSFQNLELKVESLSSQIQVEQRQRHILEEKIQKLEARIHICDCNNVTDDADNENNSTSFITFLAKVENETRSELSNLGTKIASLENHIEETASILNNQITHLGQQLEQRILDVRSTVQDYEDSITQDNTSTISNVNSDTYSADIDSESLKALTHHIKDYKEIRSLVMNSVKFPRNCEEYLKSGETDSGLFLVDPDGPNFGVAPFYVYCNFQLGSTIIGHDKLDGEVITKCPDADCFNTTMTYNATDAEIIAIIDSSVFCRQSFQFDCYLSKMTKIGSWDDRHGQRMFYFAGDNEEKRACQCGLDKPNSCATRQETNMCSCDINDPSFNRDSGFLTNKTALPLQTFYYGLMHQLQNASVKIGPLECQGEAVPEEKSCLALRLKGRSSGYYLLEENANNVQLVHCNMTAARESQVQQDLGIVQMKPKKSMKVVLEIHAGNMYTSGESIPFASVPVNDFNAFQNSKLIAPFSGLFTIRSSIKKNACQKSIQHTDKWKCKYNDYYGNWNCQTRTFYVKEPEACQIWGSVNNAKKFNAEFDELSLSKGDKITFQAVGRLDFDCSSVNPCRIVIHGTEE